jgi:hypothetical protein
MCVVSCKVVETSPRVCLSVCLFHSSAGLGSSKTPKIQQTNRKQRATANIREITHDYAEEAVWRSLISVSVCGPCGLPCGPNTRLGAREGNQQTLVIFLCQEQTGRVNVAPVVAISVVGVLRRTWFGSSFE